MKKFFTLALAVAASLSMFATITTPSIFSEDFRAMADDHDYPTEEWITYGNGAIPCDLAISQNYYNADGSGPYYVLLSSGKTAVPMALTTFKTTDDEGEAIDVPPTSQWLVTPEIYIPCDSFMLSYSVVTYTAGGLLGAGTSTYEIMVSDKGVEKDDFVSVFSGSEKSDGTRNEIVVKNRFISISGYKDKKVRLAFVATGSEVGMIGFTNLNVCDYYIVIDNKTQALSYGNEIIYPEVNVELKAPVPCDSFTATLEVGKDKETKTISDKRIYNGSSSAFALISFDTPIEIFDETIPYVITITPDYDGAPASVIESSIMVPKSSYPNNVVIEELTGTTCQYCPRGAAAMEYYLEKFPGSETEGKVIPIAIHSSKAGGTDPMAGELEILYVDRICEVQGTAGLPSASFNRKVLGKGPEEKMYVETLMHQRSNMKAEIKKVEIDKYDDYDIDFKVIFENRASYDAQGLNLRAAVVLIENDVKGINREYNQQNAYWSWNDEKVVNTFGEWLVPYMQPYINGNASQNILYAKMTYQHVARGIFPSFDGKEIASSWVADTPQRFEIEFSLPESVDNYLNTEVIILITDADTNEIYASDIMPAEKFGTTGINNVAADNADKAVYSISGVKVAEKADAINYLTPGVYISGGKKFVVK